MVDSSAGSRRARFEDVVAVVYEPLQRFVRRRAEAADVDDVVSDVLLVLWRRLDDVPHDAELPWTYGVARRCLANHSRARVRELRLVERIEQEPPAATATPEDDVVREALATLRETERELLTLWAWEGLEPREIARVLDISANAATIRLHRAKKSLKSAIDRRKDPLAAGHGQGGYGEVSRDG